jgi:hypothetical protein
MKTLTAKDPKCEIGQLIDLARAKPVAVAKHGCPVIEEFEWLKTLESPATAPAAKWNTSM